jgi:amino acid permease
MGDAIIANDHNMSPLQEPLLPIAEESSQPEQQPQQDGGTENGRDDDDDQPPRAAAEERGGSTRVGTISSACFNMWSTMVGGGCLSLPLAFVKSGNALLAPFLLLFTAGLSYFCFTLLIYASRWSMAHTYEGIAACAAGGRSAASTARNFCAVLVFFMCWFAICGYAVLLRDMVRPLTHGLFHHRHDNDDNEDDTTTTNQYWQNNALMFLIALVVTPICTLQNLTSLEKYGAASMSAIVLLGGCVVFRSGQCLLQQVDDHPDDASAPSWLSSSSSSSWHETTTTTALSTHDYHTYLRLWPDHWRDVLDVLPLYISCYVCHYNIPIVLHELRDPTPTRTRRWLFVTVAGSTIFYLLLGLAGSIYALACHDGQADGNILLDFPENDPLVLVGRLCLAVTIALAFPMLTIPARDILLRNTGNFCCCWADSASPSGGDDEEEDANSTAFDEPFLDQSLVDPSPFLPAPGNEAPSNETYPEGEVPPEVPTPTTTTTTLVESSPSSSIITDSTGPSLRSRLWSAIVVLWTGVILASVVDSIDIVWDLLGSSLSILLSYLIPAAAFLVLVRSQRGMGSSKALSYALIVLFVPLMVISTANAIINTFS